MTSTEATSRAEFLQAEERRAVHRVVAVFASIRLLPWLDTGTEIPTSIVDAVRRKLQEFSTTAEVRGFLVQRLGADLVVQANLLGANPYAQTLENGVWNPVIEALRGVAPRLGSRLTSLFSAPATEQQSKLSLRMLRFPFTERGAEPILVAKLVGGGLGGFNRSLFNLFFHPDKGSHQRLDGTRFIALVEHVPTLLAKEKRRRVYFFGDRPAEEVLHLIYPPAGEPLTVERAQVGDWAEMLSLVANPVEWAISAVYAVGGRFVHDGHSWQPTRHEPVALVGTDVGENGPCCEPIVVLRLQSGLPAVGEAHFNLGGDFHFTVGGPAAGYHTAVVPVSLDEAAQSEPELGTVRLAAYSYQSYDNGRIPPPHDVVDLFAQDRVQTAWLQKRATKYARLLRSHGEFQPFIVAEEAERRARAQAAELSHVFHSIPASELGAADPILQRAGQTSGLVLSDIKADGGGKLGHTAPPTLFNAVARASLEEARRQGSLRAFEVFAVGDDLHLLMLHDRGIDSNEIHLLAFRTFWRAVWVTELLKYKPYGLAQDLKIGPATQGKKVEELAEPSPTFVDLLADLLPEPEVRAIPQIRQALNEWTRGRATTEVRKPFAGNVTGQGPGFAELPLQGSDTVVGLLAADKAGPAAFNLPLWAAVREAVQRPEYQQRYGASAAFEIFDVHEHRRIFLDAIAHGAAVQRLLGATNLFNVKRIWSLPKAVSDAAAVPEHLGRILLSASTEKLAIIAGGEYVGKDDPVLIGELELLEHVFAFMRDRFYLTQGDERGSHYMMLVPKPLPEAIATVRSRGLQVGLRVTVANGALLNVQDVYSEPDYLEARERIEALNDAIWIAQGSEFTPVGVGARDVEPAYPLMKVLRRITGTDSKYGVWIGPVTG